MTRRKRTSDDAPDTPPRRSRAGEQPRDLLDVVGSDLLDFGQLIIAGMRTTTGEGEPDDGAQFDEGQREFSMAGQTLRSAAADDRWDGAGARAYADQNTRQQVRTETMADADQAVFSVLVREAHQIKLRRDTLDDQSDILARTSYATFPLQFVPRYGEAAKLAIESTALSGALLASTQALYDLHNDVSANAAELSQAVGRYAGVADGADALVGDFDPPEPPGGGAPTTTPTTPPVPAGDGVAGGMTAGGSAPAPGGSGGGAAGALASVVGPLAGLVTGIALAAGQAAAEQAARADDVADDAVDDATETAEDTRDEDPEHQVAAAGPGHDAAERAPVGAGAEPEPTGLPAPMPDSVNPETSPGPSAGLTPQETNLGEGVHVGG